MPFNKKINGFENEKEFIFALHGKTVKKLNPMFQEFLFGIYEDLNWNDVVLARANYGLQKADIILSVRGMEKRIGIKKGVKNSVHVEGIASFIAFLRECGVSECIIHKILLYQYGDGTEDGSGEKRISSVEYKESHQDDIDEINRCLNCEEIVLAAVNRFVLFGRNADMPIDAILYGVIDDFIWITRDEIKEIVLSHCDICATGIHFGSLFYQPMNRCLNYNEKYDMERHKVQIKWYHLSDDIIEMMDRRYRKKHSFFL